MVEGARRCPECGGEVPKLPSSGRPRRFCTDRCTRAWAVETQRLRRDLDQARVELAEAEHLAEAWSKLRDVPFPSRRWAEVVPGLRNEVRKLAEDLEVRKHV
jgi:endogenous inhibitor of DNA gyrase (YacG/DUF329 family)